MSPSTVSRELKRNRTQTGRYNDKTAQQYADIRKERLPGNRSIKPDVWKQVKKYLLEDWSAKQISGYLKKELDIHISHECIYAMIREEKKNGVNLYSHCRHKLKYRIM